MSEPFQAVKVSERVYWVGAVDWNIRDFHGYQTGRGSTYNAFLVTGESNILIDTVKKPFFDEMLSRVRSVIGDAGIDCIVSNHAELDHAGALPDAVRNLGPKKILTSKMGARALHDHFGTGLDLSIVKDGESRSIGGIDFTFLETKMLHWPDSMVTYLPGDRVLFSQDGFGMHLASTERFSDEIPNEILEQEGAKYFANILLPFSPLVTKLIERIKSLDLRIDILAPDHGPIWRKDTGRMPELWAKWALQKPKAKAVIVFDSMWQSTETMAKAIAEGLVENGISARFMPLQVFHRSDVATELLDAAGFFAGSSTLNKHLLPRMADVLTYIKGLKPRNKMGAAFGSFGWSGEGSQQVHEMLESMGVEMVGAPLAARYVPDANDLESCRQLATQAATRIFEHIEDK